MTRRTQFDWSFLFLAYLFLPSCALLEGLGRYSEIRRISKEQDTLASGIEVQRHDTEIRIHADTRTFEVRSCLVCSYRGEAPLPVLSFLVLGNPVRVREAKVDGISANVQIAVVSEKFPFLHRISIAPGAAVPPGSSFRVEMALDEVFSDPSWEAGILPGESHANAESFLIPWPRLCLDGYEAAGMLVPFRLSIHAPANQFPFASGQCVERRTEGSWNSATFESSKPAVWQIRCPEVRRAGELAFGELRLQAWYSPGLEAQLEPLLASLGSLKEILDRLSQKLGPLPSQKELQIVLEKRNPNGQMGRTGNGAIFITPEGFLPSPATKLEEWNAYGNLAHEAGDLWFGGLVPARESEPGGLAWIEGLAQFLALGEVASKYGEEVAQKIIEGWRKKTFSRGKKSRPLAAWGSEREDEEVAYGRGLLFFVSLEHRLGREKLFRVLGKMAREFEAEGLSVDELRAFLEIETGEEFQGFFRSWFHEPGVPQELVLSGS